MKIKVKMLTLLIMFTAAFGLMTFAPLGGGPVLAQDPESEARKGLQATGGTGGRSVSDLVRGILNILSWVVGVAAVIMMIIGGLRYVLANGDSSQIQSAKNTIIYALVGLVIVIFAQAIVQFVINRSTSA